MTSERHARAKQVFNAARALQGDERRRLLDDACRDDPALRAEVESLLAHEDSATFVVAADVVADAADQLGGAAREFTAGDLFADRYRIVSLLGRGGMGEVYRADDTTLDVPVALKLVRGGGGSAALLNEARLARSVTNPSVCRVFDVGEADGRYFITMEYIEGESLDRLLKQVGRMTPERVRDLALRLCEGLAAAHAEGIVHRDLKPSNVMVDATGRVVITDFGISARRETAGVMLVGTPAYMAPEQLAGHGEATERSDLYALGLILYEALTGRAATRGETIEEIAHARLRVPPAPSTVVPDVDTALEGVILALLSPDPVDRPASAQSIVDSLIGPQQATEAVAAPSSPLRYLPAALVAAVVILAAAPLVTLLDPPQSVLPPPPSVVPVATRPAGLAVLPFENLGPGGPDDPLVAGIHAEILGELTKISDLRVIARSSVLRLRDDPRQRNEIAADLNVDAVAEGTVRRIDDRLRINVELVDVRTEQQLWSDRYDRTLTPENVFEVESEVAMQIASALDARLSEGERERIRTDQQTTYAAYELYLLATYNALLDSREGFEKSVAYLEGALSADESFAPAHSRLGMVYVLAALEGWLPEREAYERAQREARRAIELNPDLAEPYTVLCRVKAQHEWAWRAAEAMCGRALELAPGEPQGHRTQAQLLAVRGRLADALEVSAHALVLDPVSGLSHLAAARRHWDARQYERAAELAAEALRLDPKLGHGYRFLGITRLFSGAVEEGLLFLEKHVENVGRSPLTLSILGYGYAVAGYRARARQVLAELEASRAARPGDLALVYLGLGREEEALAALERAVDERASLMIFLGIDPIFDPLRGDPRFERLVLTVGGLV